jgi:hypothetical protein
MQLTHLTIEQAADVLADPTTTTLTIMEWPGSSRIHVLEHNGRDIVMMVDGATGDAIVIDRDAYDGDSGGSVHDHARAIFGADADA